MFVYFASLITVVLLYIRRECFIRHNAVVCCPLWKSPLGTCVLSMLWWIILPIFLIDGWVSILFLGLKLCMKSCSPVLDSDFAFFFTTRLWSKCWSNAIKAIWVTNYMLFNAPPPLLKPGKSISLNGSYLYSKTCRWVTISRSEHSTQRFWYKQITSFTSL